MGFRLRKFVLHPAESEQDYQGVVAYQGTMAYIYLADRSTCPAKGNRCDWQRPPRLEADVMPVIRAFYKQWSAKKLEFGFLTYESVS